MHDALEKMYPIHGPWETSEALPQTSGAAAS
jgi:hypothetical protein